MRLFDLHSHWGTESGYVLRTQDALAQQKSTWNSTPKYDTEEEMAAYLRANKVRPLHDYAIETQARFADCIFGNWVQLDPRLGKAGADEFERCILASKGFVSFCVSSSGTGFPASDPIYHPFYEVAMAHHRPVLVLVGHTGAGAGLRGGGGIKLDLCHPRYVDELAIDFPDLQIVTGRPAWPWQDEMISIMIHKPNVSSCMAGHPST